MISHQYIDSSSHEQVEINRKHPLSICNHNKFIDILQMIEMINIRDILSNFAANSLNDVLQYLYALLGNQYFQLLLARHAKEKL